jgi:hypothetical protein
MPDGRCEQRRRPRLEGDEPIARRFCLIGAFAPGDFIALKQMAAREIALALGVPPMLLGMLD